MTLDTATWVGRSVAGGRYQVSAKLGEGGMGFVYRAHDCNLDCDVVIKVPRPAMLLEDPDFAVRFAREVRSLVRLVHPHIVKVTDVGQEDGTPFAVLQYLPGGSLRDRVPTTPDGGALPLPPAQLHPWVEEIASALDFIHGQGYVHRDVKPDNVLFDAHGHAFLGDFGVAKALAEKQERKKTVLTGTGVVLGTPHYMAPELVLGKPYDGRVDQYALAVMVYELLAGQYPFDGPTAPAIFVQHSTQPAPSLRTVLPGLPAPIAAAVHKGMAKDPSERYADCTAFARALIQGPEITPRPPVAGKGVCPACGKAFVVPGSARGKRVRCPGCRQTIAVPGTTVLAERVGPRATTRSPAGLPADTRPSPVSQTPPEIVAPLVPAELPPSPSRRRSPLLLVSGLLLISVLTAGTAWLLRSGTPATLAEPAPPAPATVPAVVERPKPAEPATFALRSALPPVVLRPGEERIFLVSVDRRGYDGSIRIELNGLPAGVSCAPATLSNSHDEGELHLAAGPTARPGHSQAALLLRGGETTVDRGLEVRVNPPARVTRTPPARGSAGADKVATQDRKNAPSVRGGTRPGVPKPREASPARQVAFWPQKSQCVAISPDGFFVAAGSRKGGITVWDLASQERVHTLIGHPQTVNAVAFAPNGRLIASASEDASVRLWDPASGHPLKRLDTIAPALCLAFTADGRRLFAGSADGEVHGWDVTTGSEVAGLHTGSRRVNALAITADGRRLLIGSGTLVNPDDRIHIWDVAGNKEVGTLEGHTSYVTSIALSADGRHAASASADQTIRFWDLVAGKCRAVGHGHQGLVFSVDITTDGRRVVSGGSDKTVRLWDGESGQELVRFNGHKGIVYSVAFAPNGRRALSASEQDGVRLWELGGK
jgi:serine/threonine protein kinase